ncbi:hypothetical protein AB0395_29000 [Streptosporangium sp. NPDC051023]
MSFSTATSTENLSACPTVDDGKVLVAPISSSSSAAVTSAEQE